MERSGTHVADINRALAPNGLAAPIRLGFSNTYARRCAAAQQREHHPAFRSRPATALCAGLSQEFLNEWTPTAALRAYSRAFAPRGGASINMVATKAWGAH